MARHRLEKTQHSPSDVWPICIPEGQRCPQTSTVEHLLSQGTLEHGYGDCQEWLGRKYAALTAPHTTGQT